jgi:two-component system C4-dicarboxylate transport response regulator DctD
MQQEQVFVVDDDEDSLTVLGELLEMDGLRPRLFRAAEDALAALIRADEAPSLVIVDLRTPAAPGSTLLETLRREPRWSHLPVILFTAWNSVAVAARLAIPTVRKPDIDGLFAIIAAVRHPA